MSGRPAYDKARYAAAKDGRVVSMVITAFNEERHIRACVGMALGQVGVPVEVVVVNDRSTDGTGAILDEMVASDDRLRVLHLPVNQGLRAARAAGLELACGEFVTFMDADDRMPPGKVAALMAAMQRHDADIVVAGYDKVSSADGRTFQRVRFRDEVIPGDQALERFSRGDLGSAVMWNKLYRRTLVVPHAARPLPRELDFGEDYLVAVGCFADAKRVVALSGMYHTYMAANMSMSKTRQGGQAFTLILACYVACLEMYGEELGSRTVWVDHLYARLFTFDAYRVKQGAEAWEESIPLLRASLQRLAEIRPTGIHALVHAFDTSGSLAKKNRIQRLGGTIKRSIHGDK